MSKLQTLFCLVLFLDSIIGVPVMDIDEEDLMTEDFKDPYNIDLAKSTECAMDVERICGTDTSSTNLDVITCLQNSFKEYDINEQCQNLVWNYKHNITTGKEYRRAISHLCRSVLDKLPECKREESTGHVIPCIVEHMDDPSIQPIPPHCSSLIDALEPVVFSDYRIIYKFAEACQSDIDRLNCGRLSENNDNRAPYHNQGQVLSCLASKKEELKEKCHFELLRVAELQGQDYHFDRQLYLACRNDREKFCRDVKSGEGRVYKCLLLHKSNPAMSEQCQEKLLLHQLLAEEDYKVNVKMTNACKDDIQKYDCDKLISSVASFTRAKTSAVLVCLESAQHGGQHVKGECVSELKEIRREMMEDYRVNPRLVATCSHEISQYCGGTIQKHGETIHCLMRLAEPTSDTKFESRLSKPCLNSLRELLVEVDVLDDLSVDPALHTSCRSAISAYCASEGPAETYVCLYDSLDKPLMTEDCRSSLHSLEYFSMRDFRLDPELYEACRVDAKDLCHAQPEWHKKNQEEDYLQLEGSNVLACLYKHAWKTSHDPNYKAVSKNCASHVRRVMRQRALSVNLNPEIEAVCLKDLGKFCADKSEKEEEMQCLEDHLTSLSSDCKTAVSEYIKDVDRDPTIGNIYLKYCAPMWENHCKHVLPELSMEHIDEDSGINLMRCLVLNKNSPYMNEHCLVGVEHHQLSLLKDVSFSYSLFEACSNDLAKYCPNKKTKSDSVLCLSEIHFNDTLFQQPRRISPKCVVEMKNALVERSEFVDLDEDLMSVCQDDIKKHCEFVSHRGGLMEICLKHHVHQLTSKCKEVVFKRLEQESLDPTIDYESMKCVKMMELFCQDFMKESPEKAFNCLYKHHRDVNFDQKCREYVVSRGHLFGMDFRLNNELRIACKDDAQKFCKEELRTSEENHKHEGLVLECLKIIYVHKKDQMSEACATNIKELIYYSSIDFQLDFKLTKLCTEEITNQCKHLVYGDSYEDNRGMVIECLKQEVEKGKITEKNNHLCFEQVKRVITEGLMDIHADVKLYDECSSDLAVFCRSTPIGAGKMMECLMSVYNHEQLSQQLKPSCVKIIKDRLELWKLSVPDVQFPANLQQVADIITSSPHSSYLMMLIGFLLLVILLLGMCLGRLSSKLRRELKIR